MNSLDHKCLINKSLLASLCAMAKPQQRAQEDALEKALSLLDKNLTGWAAVPVNATKEQLSGNTRWPISLKRWIEILKKSPSLNKELDND